MFLFNKAKTNPVAAEDALRGRDQAISVPARHEVLGNPLTPPWPEGFQQIVGRTPAGYFFRQFPLAAVPRMFHEQRFPRVEASGYVRLAV